MRARATFPRHAVRAACALTLLAVTGVGAIAHAADTPTPADLAKQQKKQHALEREAHKQKAVLGQEKSRMAALSQEASAALEQYAKAKAAAEQAAAADDRAKARLAKATAATQRAHLELGEFAATAYRAGGDVSQLMLLNALTSSGSLNDVTDGWVYARQAGAQKAYSLTQFQDAQAEQQDATRAAETTAAAAADTANQALAARQTATQLVADQKDLVAQLGTLADKAQADAVAAAKVTEAMRTRIETAREAEAAEQQSSGQDRIKIPADSSCKGGNVLGYPNGRLPVSALCPLYGAPWQILRADAAASFNAMSRAYEKQFGHPICITDSYRSYAAQVDAHKRKPDITATPGTSNHGWGKAVDLCAGTVAHPVGLDYSSPTYGWLQLHAPQYGWYHPSWAEPTGYRPEPWHWEFTG